MIEIKTPEREVEYKASVDEKGNLVLKRKSEIKKGRKARASGAEFELRVRRDLEEKGWIVDKWSNNVSLKEGKIIAAKKNWKYNPFRKIMMPSSQGTGFPDFVCFQRMGDYYKIIGVEVKKNGVLDKEEKEKCKWYLNKGIFSEIWIAKEEDGKIVYENFKERYEKMFEHCN